MKHWGLLENKIKCWTINPNFIMMVWEEEKNHIEIYLYIYLSPFLGEAPPRYLFCCGHDKLGGGGGTNL